METKRPKHIQDLSNQIAKKFGLTFISETEPEGNVCFVNSPELREDYRTSFTLIEILDYSYAVLHAPIYREKYKEFLIMDFPKLPYPINTQTFFVLVKLGRELRQNHLLQHSRTTNLEVSSYYKLITELVETNWALQSNREIDT